MDIFSISNLLEALAQQENEVLKASGISHRPTIGNMYEGLTADIVNKWHNRACLVYECHRHG